MPFTASQDNENSPDPIETDTHGDKGIRFVLEPDENGKLGEQLRSITFAPNQKAIDDPDGGKVRAFVCVGFDSYTVHNFAIIQSVRGEPSVVFPHGITLNGQITPVYECGRVLEKKIEREILASWKDLLSMTQCDAINKCPILSRFMVN